MRTPTDEQIEADVQSHLDRIRNLEADALREGYGALLRMNLYLRRQLCEAVSMARVIYVGIAPAPESLIPASEDPEYAEAFAADERKSHE